MGWSEIVARDCPQIEGWIEVTQLGCPNEAVERCRPLASRIRSQERVHGQAVPGQEARCRSAVQEQAPR
jgi:hypothetical protein